MSDSNVYTVIEVRIYKMGGTHTSKKIDIDGEQETVLAGLAQAAATYGPILAIEAKREFKAIVASLEKQEEEKSE